MNGNAPPERPTPRWSSLCGFLALAGAAVAALQLGHGLFPGERGVAIIGRTSCSVAAFAAILVGSRRLLARDNLPTDRLALGLDWRHARAFGVGAGLAFVHIVLLLGVLFVLAPFEVRTGPLTSSAIALAAVGYLTGNAVEELLFRGYLLIVLARQLGTTRAILLLALPFGLFHFPGLDAHALGKMVLTTGAMHFAYAYAWISTRSLAAAVAMHAVGNTLLHEVVGTGKPAALTLHFVTAAPDGVLFAVFFGVSALFALLLSRLPSAQRGAAWLAGDPQPADRPTNPLATSA